ncbi:adenylate/guanylate cyclase domain-containing protein [Sulfitobacter sp. HNIBRBA3233]|uniref:adenylate/guanylate cyclase domain-containing protein n=1 Tax=Sulfitobacter marinivivus TaxID=3158558 RepID=UPI0032E00501
MAQEQRRTSPSLSKIFRAYIEYGLKDDIERQRRRQLMCNTIMGLSALSSFVHVGTFLLLGSPYWPASFIALCIGVTFLVAPIWYSYAPTSAVVLGTPFLCGLFCVQTYLVGADSATHFYMTLTPIIWLAILGPQRPLLLGYATFIAVISVLVAMFFFDTPALSLPNYAAYSAVSRTMVVSWTVVLTLVIGFVAFLRAERAEDALEAEHARSEALLYNLLPNQIASRLKSDPSQTIADRVPQVGILFADIVNFTPRSLQMNPDEVVNFLNLVFSKFDELADRHGLEKIKTIGDAYMVAAGIPTQCSDPVHRIADMALDMLETTRSLSAGIPGGVDVRIGLHGGPAVAGVIGIRKLFYDVWGDTVNTASRMESHGEPGRIQVMETVRTALERDYVLERRGTIDAKGMGAVTTWWLIARRSTPA